MEAHPCQKESFLDNVWRYVNEIVSFPFHTPLSLGLRRLKKHLEILYHKSNNRWSRFFRDLLRV